MFLGRGRVVGRRWAIMELSEFRVAHVGVTIPHARTYHGDDSQQTTMATCFAHATGFGHLDGGAVYQHAPGALHARIADIGAHHGLS